MTEPIDTMKQRLTEAIAWSKDPDDWAGTPQFCNLIDAVKAYLTDLARIERIDLLNAMSDVRDSLLPHD